MKKRGFKRLGILGTRYLMEGPVYPRVLEKRDIVCDADSSLPPIDSARTLARAALREAGRVDF